MPKFSMNSKRKLGTCHKDLQLIFNTVIKFEDCTIIEGARSFERQVELVEQGMSKTFDSKHIPGDDGNSRAVDVMKYPIDWQDKERVILFAGKVLGVAQSLLDAGKISHNLRWGGDWDGDGNVREHSFFDGPHFELVEIKSE